MLNDIDTGEAAFASEDGMGNLAGLSRCVNGNVTLERCYGPFGESIRREGAFVSSTFGFASKFTDVETGLIYYGFRFYSPDNGRWLGRDPLGESGGVGLYVPVENAMINKVDYLGLCELTCCPKDLTVKLLPGTLDNNYPGIGVGFTVKWTTEPDLTMKNGKLCSFGACGYSQEIRGFMFINNQNQPHNTTGDILVDPLNYVNDDYSMSDNDTQAPDFSTTDTLSFPGLDDWVAADVINWMWQFRVRILIQRPQKLWRRKNSRLNSLALRPMCSPQLDSTRMSKFVSIAIILLMAMMSEFGRSEEPVVPFKRVWVRWNGPRTRSVPECMLVNSNSVVVAERWLTEAPIIKSKRYAVMAEAEADKVFSLWFEFRTGVTNFTNRDGGYVIEFLSESSTNMVFIGMGQSASNQLFSLKKVLNDNCKNALMEIDRKVDGQMRTADRTLYIDR